MAKTTSPLLPSTAELLLRLGERLRLARKRRHLTAKQVAQRAGMAPMTLRSLECGGSGVTMGAYLAVMQVLGVEQDLNLLAAADPLGRELQDARLNTQAGGSPWKIATRRPPVPFVADVLAPALTLAAQSAKEAPDASDGFASAADLVKLLAPTTADKKPLP